MTEGEERREYIIQLLTQTKKPISGTELAKQMKGKPSGDRAGHCTASRIKPKYSLNE